MKKAKHRKVVSPVEIDKYRLDEELEGQPNGYLSYADALAEAEADLEEAKAELEVVTAEYGQSIRADPKAFGVSGRLTDKGIEQATTLQPEYQSAHRAVRQAKAKAGKLKAITRAFEHRKSALENLVYLQGQGYTAERPNKRLPVRDAVNSIKVRRAFRPLDSIEDD